MAFELSPQTYVKYALLSPIGSSNFLSFFSPSILQVFDFFVDPAPFKSRRRFLDFTLGHIPLKMDLQILLYNGAQPACSVWLLCFDRRRLIL